MKGIDKRIHKNETVSYRARVRIKGHPVLSQSFASKTLAMKWKRDTESAVEQGKYQYSQPGSKNTLAELINRYIEKVLPSKPKNARNVRQHLLWWKQELGHCLLSDIKPSLIAQKRDELLSGLTCKGKFRSSTTVVRYLASLSHVFATAIKDWEWIQPTFRSLTRGMWAIRSICFSPLKRAKETKEVISKNIEANHYEIPALGECSLQVWNDMTACGVNAYHSSHEHVIPFPKNKFIIQPNF